MTIVSREWLPDGAASSTRLASACQGMLAVWQEAWLVRGAEPVTLQACRLANAGDEPSRIASAPGVELVQTPAMTADLQRALVGPFDRAALTPSDENLLDNVVRAALRDFGEQLVAGAVAGGSGGGVSTVTLACGGVSLARLKLSRDLVIRLIKAPIVRNVRPPPPRLWAALEHCKVPISAELGSAEVSLDDLGALVVGDVLVLEAAAGAQVELCAGGSVLGCGALTEAVGHNALRMTSGR